MFLEKGENLLQNGILHIVFKLSESSEIALQKVRIYIDDWHLKDVTQCRKYLTSYILLLKVKKRKNLRYFLLVANRRGRVFFNK